VDDDTSIVGDIQWAEVFRNDPMGNFNLSDIFIGFNLK
jgi:hypothetical protein